MRPMTQTSKTSFMIGITLVLLLLIGVSGIYATYTSLIMRTDAKLINNLGLVRGTTQRLLYFEMMSETNHNLIDEINLRLEDLIGRAEVQDVLPRLIEKWEQLKTNIITYRENQDAESKLGLQQSGDDFWVLSNQVVLQAQHHSERKLLNFIIVVSLFMISVGLTIVLLVLLRKHVQNSLEYLANYDSLTGVANRALYQRMLNDERERAIRYKRPLCLIMFDIDHFKQINDMHGHDIGDNVLQQITSLVAANIRSSDLLARIGGDEFIIIAPETTIAHAEVLADKLRQTIANFSFVGSKSLTISVGIAELVDDEDAYSFFKRVDDALYRAKNGGRNRVAR